MSGDVRTEIDRRTSDTRIRRSMLLGALLEGGSWTGPWATGDHGTSGGPFQIHWTVHPDVVREANRRGITPEQLVNDASYATGYMLPEYQAAAAKVGADVWAGNPELAAERTAYLAERPAQDYYTTRGAGTIDTLYKRAASAGPGASSGAAPADPPAAAPQAGSGQPDAATTGKSSTGVLHVHIPIPWAPDVHFGLPWLRMLLGVLGLVLVVVGLRIMFAQAAGAAAAGGKLPIPVEA